MIYAVLLWYSQVRSLYPTWTAGGKNDTWINRESIQYKTFASKFEHTIPTMGQFHTKPFIKFKHAQNTSPAPSVWFSIKMRCCTLFLCSGLWETWQVNIFEIRTKPYPGTLSQRSCTLPPNFGLFTLIAHDAWLQFIQNWSDFVSVFSCHLTAQ